MDRTEQSLRYHLNRLPTVVTQWRVARQGQVVFALLALSVAACSALLVGARVSVTSRVQAVITERTTGNVVTLLTTTKNAPRAFRPAVGDIVNLEVSAKGRLQAVLLEWRGDSVHVRVSGNAPRVGTATTLTTQPRRVAIWSLLTIPRPRLTT